MLQDIVSDQLAADVTRLVHERGQEIAAALGAHMGKPISPRIAEEVKTVVQYARDGGAVAKLSNDDIVAMINSVIRMLSATCYPPATLVARTIFDRKSTDPESDIEIVLLAAKARWDIELGMNVKIRWLAALGGVSVKTARNLASAGQFSTLNKGGDQMIVAKEAARWLSSRGVTIKAGSRASNRIG